MLHISDPPLGYQDLFLLHQPLEVLSLQSTFFRFCPDEDSCPAQGQAVFPEKEVGSPHLMTGQCQIINAFPAHPIRTRFNWEGPTYLESSLSLTEPLVEITLQTNPSLCHSSYFPWEYSLINFLHTNSYLNLLPWDFILQQCQITHQCRDYYKFLWHKEESI